MCVFHSSNPNPTMRGVKSKILIILKFKFPYQEFVDRLFVISYRF